MPFPFRLEPLQHARITLTATFARRTSRSRTIAAGCFALKGGMSLRRLTPCVPAACRLAIRRTVLRAASLHCLFLISSDFITRSMTSYGVRSSQTRLSQAPNLRLILGDPDRPNERRNLQTFTKKHHLRPLRRGSRAVPDAVNDMARAYIKVADGLHIVVRDDPSLASDAADNEIRDAFVVVTLIEIIIEIATLDVVRRVKVYKRFPWPPAIPLFRNCNASRRVSLMRLRSLAIALIRCTSSLALNLASIFQGPL